MELRLYSSRILVVEDESFMRTLILKALDGLGFSVVAEAANGEEALRHLGRNRVDVIISDIVMMPVDGFELIRAVRMGRTPQARTTPVIFLTGLSDLPTVSSASRLNVQGFIVKPASASQLLVSLRHALKVEVKVQPVHIYERMSLASTEARRQPETEVPGEEELQSAVRGSREGGHTPAPHTGPALVDVLMIEEGMTLRQDICVNGALLVKADTRLTAAHVTALQDLRAVLDERRVRVELPAEDV